MADIKHTAYIIDTDGQVTTHDGKITLRVLQGYVDGDIEICPRVPYINGVAIPTYCTVYANEEGVLKGMAVNQGASKYRGPLVVVRERNDRYYKFALSLKSLPMTAPYKEFVPPKCPVQARFDFLDGIISSCDDVQRSLDSIINAPPPVLRVPAVPLNRVLFPEALWVTCSTLCRDANGQPCYKATTLHFPGGHEQYERVALSGKIIFALRQTYAPEISMGHFQIDMVSGYLTLPCRPVDDLLLCTSFNMPDDTPIGRIVRVL